jgi:hypothetical protein
MLKAILVIILLAACSDQDQRPRPPTKAEPMLRGDCVDRVVPNLFGPGDVSYQECRWQERIWVCRLEIDSYRTVQAWRCVAVADAPTRTAPAAPAAPAPAARNG